MSTAPGMLLLKWNLLELISQGYFKVMKHSSIAEIRHWCQYIQIGQPFHCIALSHFSLRNWKRKNKISKSSKNFELTAFPRQKSQEHPESDNTTMDQYSKKLLQATQSIKATQLYSCDTAQFTETTVIPTKKNSLFPPHLWKWNSLPAVQSWHCYWKNKAFSLLCR